MDSQTTADEIRGLITLGLLDEARAELDRADNLDDPYILEAARRYHLGIGDWENAAKIGLHLLNNFPERRTHPTPLNTSIALYRLGRTAEAATVLKKYPPDDSEPCPTCHYYSLACYLAILGRNQEALGVLNIAFNAGSDYWNKAFFDRDLRGLFQWLGDLESYDDELRAILSDPLWTAVLEGTDSTADFILDPSDLELYPKLRSLVSYNPSRAVYVPKNGIGARGRRVLHEWQRSRSRWATRRLRKAIVRATGDASAEPAKTGVLTSEDTLDHLKKTELLKPDTKSTASEIRGLTELGLLDEARAVLDRSDLRDPLILSEARFFYMIVEDWKSAAQAGLQLLNYPEQRTWRTGFNAALALHRVGRTSQAVAVLYEYQPDKSAFSRKHHFYALACYLSKLGRYWDALRALHVSLGTDREYWTKSFVDYDLRRLWQWVGDLGTTDEKLNALLGDALWIEVLAGVVSSRDFLLDARDLELHPKLWSMVEHHPSRPLYQPRQDIAPNLRRNLQAWLQSRSRWATRRLRKSIAQARHAGVRQARTTTSFSPANN